ncbi:hypothetical protein ACFX1T_044520 [Malus domestica]
MQFMKLVALHLQLQLRLAVVDLCFQDLFRVRMAVGIGDAVAHRAVDALMGPRRVTIRNEAAAAASPTPAVPARPAAAPVLETMASTSSISGSDACSNHSKAFQDCIDEFVSDISKCQWYMDKLYECKNNSGMLSA